MPSTRHAMATLATTLLLLVSAAPLAAVLAVAPAAAAMEGPAPVPAPVPGLAGPALADVPADVRARVEAAMASPKLLYEPNLGQAPGDVRFFARAGGVTVSLLDDGLALHLVGDAAPTRLPGAPPLVVGPGPEARADSATTATLVLRFEGAARVAPRGADLAEARASYLLGNDPSRWLQDVPTYHAVRYADLYPGIDMVVHGTEEHPLKYDLVVAAGADPARAVMVLEGAQSLRVTEAGELVMGTTAGDVTQAAPFVYQDLDGARVPVEAAYHILDPSRVAFRLGAYDPTQPLVIDPGLIYASAVGSYGNDVALGAALDSAGNAFVTGYTQSSSFPMRNASLPEYQGWYDAFVAKFSPTGAVLWSTYFGGRADDYGYSLAADAAGNLVLVGLTYSPDLPVAAAIQATPAGSGEGYIARFSPTGALLSSTYYGGNSDDGFSDVALDAAGNIVATGYSYSTTFPVLAALQPAKVGAVGATYDGVMVKVNPTATTRLFSTYYGGAGNDGLARVAIDASGNIVAGGTTSSADLNLTAGALQATKKLGAEAFLLRVTAAGVKNYATYFGGTSDDYLNGLAVDGSGNVIAGGYTYSTDLPTVAATQPVHGGGGEEGWILKLNSNGASLAWMTYLGGAGYDVPTNIVVDPAGNSYQSLTTASVNYAGTRPNGQPCYSEPAVVKRAPNGTILLNRCLGATSSAVYGLAVDSTQKPLVAGLSGWGGDNWPNYNAAQPYHAGSSTDVVLARLTTNLTFYDFSTHWGGTSESAQHGMAFRTSDDVAFVAGSQTFQHGGWGGPGPYSPLGGSSEATLRGYKANGALWYAITLGGSGFDQAYDVAVAPNDDVLVVGTTTSTDMPIKNAAQATLKGGKDAFVARLRPGAAVGGYNFSTYLGGSLDDIALGAAFDGSGNAIVAGETLSTDLTTLAPRQAAKAGGKDAFVAKLNATGGLVYSTYHGGLLDDVAHDAAADAAGNAYVVGTTSSTNFPVLAGWDTTANGGTDAFMSKLNAAGSALAWSSYLGGSGNDEGRGIAVDNAGNTYLAGVAGSANFPITVSGFDPVLNGTSDAFLTKMGTTGGTLSFSTFFGGGKADGAYGLTVNAATGEAAIVGFSNSTDLPLKNNPQSGKFPCNVVYANVPGWYCNLATNPGSGSYYQNVTDGFVAKFVTAGNALNFSTYLGSWYADELRGVAVDDKGNTLVAGTSQGYYIGQASPAPTWNNYFSHQYPVGTILILARCDPPPESTATIISGTRGNDNWWKSSQVTMSFVSNSFCPLASTWNAVPATNTTFVGGTTHIFNQQGNHTARFYAIDVDGNVGPQNTSWVRIDSVDPVSTVTCNGIACKSTAVPSTAWYTVAVTAAYASTDAPIGGTHQTSGVDTRYHRANLNPIVTCGGTGPCQDLLTADGKHNVTYYGEDVAGNVETARIQNIWIDRTKPVSVSQVDGAEGNDGWFKSNVTVFLSATDPTSGVARIQYRVDGGALVTYTNFFAIAGDGCHTLQHFATDVAGNVEATQSRQVCIDTSPPTVDIGITDEGNVYLLGNEDPLEPELPLTVVVGTVNLTATATDAASGVARVEFLVDGELRGSDATAPYTWTWEAGKEGLGTHTIEARAWDVAGWSGSNFTSAFTVPTTSEGIGRSCRDDLAVEVPPESPVFVPGDIFPKVCAPVRALLVGTLPTIPPDPEDLPALPPEPPAIPPELPPLPEPPAATVEATLPLALPVAPPPLPALPPEPPTLPPELPPLPPTLPEPPALPPELPEPPTVPTVHLPEAPELPPPPELEPADIAAFVDAVFAALGL